jgi:hypothetical protein
MARARLDADAEAELHEAATHYEHERTGLGRDFLLEFRAVLGRVEELFGTGALVAGFDDHEVRRSRSSASRTSCSLFDAKAGSQSWLSLTTSETPTTGATGSSRSLRLGVRSGCSFADSHRSRRRRAAFSSKAAARSSTVWAESR